jgi:membrane-associated phospholipid phosphatase
VLRGYFTSLESHPWRRAVWQGLACGAGIAIGFAIAGKSWLFVVIVGAVAAVVIAVLFGFLLRLQTPRREPRQRG